MLKSLHVLFLLSLFVFTGCSLKDFDVKEQETVKPIKKEVELTKEPITKELLNTIDKIVYLISTNQRTKLYNHYIHKDLGYFDVYLEKKVPKIKRKYILDGKEKDYFSIANSIRRAGKYSKNLKLERFTPVFFCSPNDDEFYGWNKQGLFLSENIHFPMASRLVDIKKVDDLKFANMVDKLSYKVVLSEAEIVFFMTYIDRWWYITLFDRASFDCSSN